MPFEVRSEHTIRLKAGQRAVEVDDVQLFAADEHVARVKVAVQADFAHASGTFVRSLDAVQNELGDTFVGQADIRGHEVVVEQVLARGHQQRGEIEGGGQGEPGHVALDVVDRDSRRRRLRPSVAHHRRRQVERGSTEAAPGELDGVIGGAGGELEGGVHIRAEDGTPIYLRDVAAVKIGPQTRQGAVTRDGVGERVAGMVIMSGI